MLQAIRSRAAGIVVKVLFSLLVISFAVWGIGDYSFLRQGETTAIQIGDVKISANTVEQQYRVELNRLRRMFGGQIDPETAKQFGLLDQVIERIVTETLLNKAADELGLRVGDEAVRSRLMTAPELQGPGGFERARFQQLLYETGLSESAFVAQFRSDLARSLVTDAMSAGIRPPDVMIDRLYRYRNERRAGQSVFIPASSFLDVGLPNDEQLQAVYDANRERFTAPEYRALTVVRIGADDIEKQITVDDRQIEDEFRARQAELRVPEKRELEQILYTDEAQAKTAREKLAGGASFLDVAKEANQSEETVKLGLVSREDLPPELAEGAFALAANTISEPVKSPFGWHLFRVTRIEAGREPSLAEMKERLTIEVRTRLAADAAYEHATKVEEAVAGGAKLEDAAEKGGVTAVKVAAVDPRGMAPSGEAVAALAGAQQAMAIAFDTPGGSETQLMESGENTWFIIRVDGITPATQRPLADVREDAVKLWQSEKREEAARARGEQILEAVKAGRTLEAASSPFGLKPAMLEPVARSASMDVRAAVPPEVTNQLFNMALNETAVAIARDGVHVVTLAQIVPADPATDQDGVSLVRARLQQQMSGDLVSEYANALRQRYGVTINRSIVDKIG